MQILPRRNGFTLIEVVIAVSLVAIMAMAVAPNIAQRINRTREAATVRELDRIRVALLDYYEDLGHFPDEAEGLAALVVNPGEANWSGPYLTYGNNDPTAAATVDQFGEPYVYDLAPTTTPAGAADVIVASNGINRGGELYDHAQGWRLADAALVDDLFVLLNAAGQDRAKKAETISELEALADAARAYYRARHALPDSLGDLAGEYISAGIRQSALIDGWGEGYRIDIVPDVDPVLRIWSAGADRDDDDGADDDYLLEINTAALDAESLDPDNDDPPVPEEGSYTRYLVETAQAALDAAPALPLGDTRLSAYLADLGLSAIFEYDDWGHALLVNPGARQVYSPGPDGSDATTTDNTPAGVGP